MPQLNSEDAKAENKAMLAISPESQTFIWQAAILTHYGPVTLRRVAAPGLHPPTETPVGALTRRPHLALSSRLRAFVVHLQFRSSGSTA